MSGGRGPRRRVDLVLVSERRRGRRRAWRVKRRSELRRDAWKAVVSRIAIRAEGRRRDLHVRHDIGEPRRVKEVAGRREWRRVRPCIALAPLGLMPTIALLVIVAEPCIVQRRKQTGGCRSETRWLCAHENGSAESASHASGYVRAWAEHGQPAPLYTFGTMRVSLVCPPLACATSACVTSNSRAHMRCLVVGAYVDPDALTSRAARHSTACLPTVR